MSYDRNALRAELSRDEGRRSTVYDDDTGLPIVPGSIVRGHPTVGIGRALDVNPLTDAEIDLLFDNGVVKVERELDANLPWWRQLTDARQRVLVNMCFNLGIGGLLKFQNALGAMRFHDYETAAKEMADSLWYTQVGDRAKRLCKMMREG